MTLRERERKMVIERKSSNINSVSPGIQKLWEQERVQIQ